jgi:transcriptional regulator with XRE-family HTH domain
LEYSRVDPAVQKGTRTLNENLRRALLRAQLTDEDVAARLDVDPKTVRRWLEGRLPYLRHRWALAGMLALDETDLWPQVRAAPTLPAEVRAIYPHRYNVPPEVWRGVFVAAQEEIGILADSALFLAIDEQILGTLISRVKAGVQIRICLRDPNWPGASDVAVRTRDALARYGSLCEGRNVQIRLHRVILNNAIYRADHELLVSQRAFGIRAERRPVVYLRRPVSGDMAAIYLESFDRIWADALPLARHKY